MQASDIIGVPESRWTHTIAICLEDGIQFVHHDGPEREDLAEVNCLAYGICERGAEVLLVQTLLQRLQNPSTH